MSKPSWDEYFLRVAHVVASRATCDRAHVGAILVRNKQILSTGYNGAPTGQPSCDEVGHLLIDNHCQRAVHAEANAIVQAALHGVSTQDAVCYVTHFPCLVCTKLLINAAITRVVFHYSYRVEPIALQMLLQAGIQVASIAHVDM